MEDLVRHFYVDTKSELEAKIASDEVPSGALVMVLDTKEIYFKGQYFASKEYVVKTQDQYNELERLGQVDPNLIYFITEN